MYCPQCKAEYRQGFTRCADCDVELVHEPPPAAHGMGATGEAGLHAEDSEDPFCSFWRGDDPRLHAELCELLTEEGIAHKTVRREDHLFNLNTKSAFQIGIPFSQFEKAEAAIKDAYGTEEEQEDAARLLPYRKGYAPAARGTLAWRPLAKGFTRTEAGQSEETENDGRAALEEAAAEDNCENGQPDWDPTNWNPEEARVRVWSSEDSYPGEMIEMALRENQIHARFEKADGKNAIFVLPEDEVRASEIVREIVEGEQPR
jgi:hypothetical protein